MVMRTNKRFNNYAGTKNSLSAQQALGIAASEIGQEWDFMLTLRLSNTTSKNSRSCTTNDAALIQHIDAYFYNLSQRIHKKPIYRSVYLHKLGDEFHAHVYSKYPLRVNPSDWDITLRQEWFKLPLLQGADSLSDICFQQTHKHSDSTEWGVYGIKRNGEQTAWILDSSLFLKNLTQAYKRGVRRLKRKGEHVLELPTDFKLKTINSQKR
jgi:hypothetical protein